MLQIEEQYEGLVGQEGVALHGPNRVVQNERLQLRTRMAVFP